MSTRTLAALLAILASVSCGGSKESPTAPPVITVRIVAGDGVTDTVQAKPAQALTVEVLDDGQPRSGVAVQFEALRTSSPSPVPVSDAGVLVSRLAGTYYSDLLTDTTDANGRASVLVQLGMRTGATGVQITCARASLTATAKYTVLPGNAALLIASVPDTAVRVGGTYAIGAYGADRFGNARPQDTVTYQAIDAAGTVNAAGSVRAKLAVARGTVVVRGNGFEDSVHYTVVPVARITAIYVGPDAVRRLVTMDLDGSNPKVITPTVPLGFWANASHSPIDDLIVYDSNQGIALVKGDGSARVLVDATMASQARYPIFSPDGKSIYFMGTSNASPSSGFGVWRIGLDGSGLTQIATTNDIEATPAVSPDGTRFAFSHMAGLYIHSPATGAAQLMGPRGWFPNFSPDGNLVAYSDNGALRIVGGTSAPTINVGTVDYARVSWMPDNRWILTRRGDGPVLVNSINWSVVPAPGLSRLQEISVDR